MIPVKCLMPMDKDFEILNHTVDVGIIAYGADLSQAFANAARALFSLITELDDVEEVTRWDIELTTTDEESLLVGWLDKNLPADKLEMRSEEHDRLKSA